MMPNKLENLSGWYIEATIGKVKCLIYEASFAKKATRIQNTLDIKALMAFKTRVFCCAKEQYWRSKGSSTNVVVLFYYTRKELE